MVIITPQHLIDEYIMEKLEMLDSLKIKYPMITSLLGNIKSIEDIETQINILSKMKGAADSYNAADENTLISLSNFVQNAFLYDSGGDVIRRADILIKELASITTNEYEQIKLELLTITGGQ